MMNVLHLPTSVGGNAWALAQGEKALGLNSSVLVSADTWLDYPADIQLHLEQVSGRISQAWRLLRTFQQIRKRYDVFHFNFGSTLFSHPALWMLPHAELPWYPSSAKCFVTYNGCDARQKSYTLKKQEISACADPCCGQGVCGSPRMEAYKRRSIAKMARYVRHIWALNPDLLHVLPMEKSSFLPYALCLDRLPVARPDLTNKKLRVLHAPTNQLIKGTGAVITALEEVNRKKPNSVEMIFIENVPHHKALEMYARADLVIDQLLVGWYGGFAVEAMAMGKPVICRIEEDDLDLLPPSMASELEECIIQADAATLVETILHCLEDRVFLRRRAEASVDYARKWHETKRVAKITKAKYETP